jgi:hypothetical protein
MIERPFSASTYPRVVRQFLGFQVLLTSFYVVVDPGLDSRFCRLKDLRGYINLLQYLNSGRIGTMVIAALNLFNFPFGTIFGIVALYVLFQPEVEQLYTK